VLFDAILAGQYDFPSPDWDGISDDAKNFVTRMLMLDPARRMSCEQARSPSRCRCRHPFGCCYEWAGGSA
jgi:serine/threonine protein kinase